MNNKNLNSLKVGEEVCVKLCNEIYIRKIIKITPTGRFNLSDGEQYYNDGRCVNNHYRTIELLTEENKTKAIEQGDLSNNYYVIVYDSPFRWYNENKILHKVKDEVIAVSKLIDETKRYQKEIKDGSVKIYIEYKI